MKPEQITLAVNPFLHHSRFCPWLTVLVAKKPSGCMQYLDQKCSRNSVYLRSVLLQPHSNPTGPEKPYDDTRGESKYVVFIQYVIHRICITHQSTSNPVLCEAGTIIQCQGGLPLLSAGMWHLSAQCQADVVGKRSSCPRQRGRSGSAWICGGLRWVVMMSPPCIYYCAVGPIRVMKGYVQSRALGSHWTSLLFPSLHVGWPFTSRCLSNHETKRPCKPCNPYKYDVPECSGFPRLHNDSSD